MNLTSSSASASSTAAFTPENTSLDVVYNWLKANRNQPVIIARYNGGTIQAKLPRLNDSTERLVVGFSRKFSTLTHWSDRQINAFEGSGQWGQLGFIVEEALALEQSVSARQARTESINASIQAANLRREAPIPYVARA